MFLRYFFVDMNSYFASVEQQLRPELRGQPVAVAPVLAETSCCIAASYEAKRFGIRTGTMIRDAMRLCPKLRVVEARPRMYVTMHHRIVQAVESCVHVSNVLSIDEMVCQLIGDEQRPERVVQTAGRLKSALRRDVGEYLRCSIGVGPNRMLAKVASDMQKPDGMTMIRRDELPGRLHGLQLNDFPGIGPRMEQRLRRAGVATVEQLCRLSAAELGRVWGSKVLGQAWWHNLRGDDVPEKPTQRRTVGHSRVLSPECRNDADSWAILLLLLQKAAARLRHIGYWAGSLNLSIRFLHGHGWQDRQRLNHCQDTLTMLHAAQRLWQRRPRGGTPLQVGVVLCDLVEGRNMPAPLFLEERKLLDLSKAMDVINQKYGAYSVYLGGTYQFEGTVTTRIAFTRIPDLDLPDA